MASFTTSSYLLLLDELFNGPSNTDTWVIDNETNAGFFGTLAKVNARDASEPVNQNGATIASHTEHVRWAMEYAMTKLSGTKPTESWDASWRIKEVEQETWQDLIDQLKLLFRKFRESVEMNSFPDSPELQTYLLSVLPHMAYHLGAIRQMIIRL